MDSIIKSGRTVKEAVDAALQELGKTEDEVLVEVLEEPTKGFLGLIGGKLARVKVTVKENKVEKAVKFLESVIKEMGLEDATVEVVSQGDPLKINLKGTRLGILIGRRGQTLDALQYLTNLVVNKNSENRIKIILDIEEYRRRREQTLERLALRLAEQVRRKGKSITLEPMNPHERRIIHTTLQNNPYVVTMSEGEEPYRKVIILAK
ncbi:MAG TPA: protein jag [Clostridia bacterium]|nr:protein jag [Clostridia bacterium]